MEASNFKRKTKQKRGPEARAQGRKNRAAGARFELKVRKQLESEGWIVDKWTNNIDLDNSCIVQAKSNRFLLRGCGFPDFVAFKKIGHYGLYELKFVECKTNGILSKIEKLKMEWLKNEGYECFVASKDGKSVEYKRPNSVFRKDVRDRA